MKSKDAHSDVCQNTLGRGEAYLQLAVTGVTVRERQEQRAMLLQRPPAGSGRYGSVPTTAISSEAEERSVTGASR